MSTSDVVVSQRVPEKANLVCVPLNALSDDWLHFQGPHFVRVLGDELTQLIPQLQQRSSEFLEMNLHDSFHNYNRDRKGFGDELTRLIPQLQLRSSGFLEMIYNYILW